MVFVSHSSSLPGTWFMPLAEESTWAVRLGAAAEQTKDAPLGLHARDRILQHTRGGVRRWDNLQGGEGMPCMGAGTRLRRPPAHLGISSLMLISQRFFLASVS